MAVEEPAGKGRCRKPLYSVALVGAGFILAYQGLSCSSSSSSSSPPTTLARTEWRSQHPERRLLYNRVPKCGSTTLLTLLRKLSRRNRFHHVHSTTFDKRLLTRVQQAELVEDIMSTSAPSSYDRHVYFVDFQSFGHPYPAYVNMVRDPVERLASSFYYRRAVAAANLNASGNKQPWLLETFEDCVKQEREECSFHGGGQHRSLSVPYFCGHDNRCLSVQNTWALNTALRNIERHYAVVGVLEDLNVTLALLEKLLPRFFRGASEVYGKRGLHANCNLRRPRKVERSTRKLLKRKLSLEFQLYEFVRQRLHAQWQAS
ncbi:heparan sulfate 2-O-sulfotransferase pipe [Haemaphysalis longicornis]